MQTRLTLIVAATANNGIGKNGGLPWRLPKEMAYFARVTSDAPDGALNAVVMGRNTWESIPTKFKPLKRRLNIVISRNADYKLMPEGMPVAAPTTLQPNLQSVLDKLADPTGLHRVFVIGGRSLYDDTLRLAPEPSRPFVDRVLLTRVLSPAFEDCDVFFPDLQQEYGGAEWQRTAHADLQQWVGFDVPEGPQEENGVKYEYQMWIRSPEGKVT